VAPSIPKKLKSSFTNADDRKRALACTRCQRRYAFHALRFSFLISLLIFGKKTGVSTFRDCNAGKPILVKYVFQRNSELSFWSSSALIL